jgi:histidine triad (HIT) family protein
MEGCIFCRIVAGQLPCVKVFEDQHVLAFLDINPIRDGHTLLIPKRHAENLFEIAAEDLAAIHLASQRLAQAMRGALGVAGIACLQLNGRAVNQVVMHYHLHLIPQAASSAPLTMTDWQLVPGDLDAIRATGRRLAAALA